MRLTEFAPAAESASVAINQPAAESASVTANQPDEYGPPQWARRSFTKGFAGVDFVPHPDGSLRCPAGHPLRIQERRPERNGSVRVVYGARIAHCRPCPLRVQCQESATTRKPRQVSAVLWPIEACASVPAQPLSLPQVASSPSQGSPPVEPFVPHLAVHPVLWGDWPRCQPRRRWMHLLRTQSVELAFRTLPPEENLPPTRQDVQTRAQRAHYRLSWPQRLTRNARPSSAPVLTITLHGLPAAFARSVGIEQVTAA